MNWQAVALNDNDNVALVLKAVESGERIMVSRPGGLIELIATEAVPFCHKIALADIETGQAVLRYGEAIGVARSAIGEGCVVHTHNLVSRRAQQKRPAP